MLKLWSERIVNRVINRVGYDLRRVPAPYGDAFAAQAALLRGVGWPVICDVGAHIGKTARRYLRLLPTAQLYCFEPFPASREAFRARVGSPANVRLIAAAVADTPGERTFHVNENSSLNSLLPAVTKGRMYHHASKDLGTIRVPVTTLDEFTATERIERIHVLKIDVEGGERQALRGARTLLAAGRIDLIYVELGIAVRKQGEAYMWDVCTDLAGLGYRLFNLYDLQHAKDGQLRRADALFLRDDAGALGAAGPAPSTR